MSQFLKDLLIASCISAVIGLLSDCLKENIRRSLSLVCSLVLLFYILSPLAELIKRLNDGNISPGLPYLTIECDGDGDSGISMILQESEKILQINEKEYIAKKYGLCDEDFSLDIKLIYKSDKCEVQTVVLSVHSVKGLSVEKEIKDYLEDKYLCQCYVEERLMNTNDIFS